ncbi:uncharacterized protein TNCV_5032641 [Trichonephila clavipes]|nr:uncharacterized protein TNCV_5032641 [Trichonephila clavipes]
MLRGCPEPDLLEAAPLLDYCSQQSCTMDRFRLTLSAISPKENLLPTSPTTQPRSNSWLEHRTPDRKAWVRYPMPPNTLRVHTEYVLVKSVGPKSCGQSHERRDWRIFPSPSVHAEIVEVEIGGVAIYHPLGEFRRAKSYCHLYADQGQRQAYL